MKRFVQQRGIFFYQNHFSDHSQITYNIVKSMDYLNKYVDSFSGKNEITSNLDFIVNVVRNEISVQESENNYEIALFAHLSNIINSEAPYSREEFNKIVSHYKNALDSQNASIELHSRSIEDLSDISQRFLVVFNAANEYRTERHNLRDIRKSIETCQKNLDQERSMNGKNVDKLQSQLASLINQRDEQLIVTRDVLSKFISQKKKFNDFRIRRLTQSYHRYGESLVELSKQKQFYDDLKSSIEEAQSHIDEIIENGRNSEIDTVTPEQTMQSNHDPTTEVNETSTIAQDQTISEQQNITEDHGATIPDEPISTPDEPISNTDEPISTPEVEIVTTPQVENEQPEDGYSPLF